MKLCDQCGHKGHVFKPLRRDLPDGTRGFAGYEPGNDWLPSLAYPICYVSAEADPYEGPFWHVPRYVWLCEVCCAS